MKTSFSVLLATVSASPIEKVITLLGDLETKIIKEGEGAHKVYAEFAEWCEDTSKDVSYEIKTGKGNVADLKATIEKESANIAVQESTVEDLAGQIATDDADLQAATAIRTKESATFVVEQKDLVETSDTIERAVGIIEKELNGGAAFAQIQKASTVTQALTVMVQAQSISVADGKKLSALVQTASDDDDSGAPDPAVYDNQSGGVLDTLNKLLEEAQSQLEDARNKETASIQAFQMMKQGLEDEIKFANKEMDESKQSKSASAEGQAVAEGDLAVTSKDLSEDIKTLQGLHHNCMTKANEFEAEVKSRGEELKALATAKKIIKETTSGAADQSYGLDQESFLQLPGGDSRAVRYVRQLAKQQQSPALAQLASRMESTMRFSSGNQADIFGKVKTLIRDMIEKLESAGEADATKKAYCDKELAETRQKKEDKTAEIEKLSAKIGSSKAKSSKLKEEVATLQSELAALTREQAQMDKIRGEEKAAFDTNSAEMEQGLDGVKMALKVLNEYYAKSDKSHSSAEGASTGIIGLLEVVESDFSKGLAEMKAGEESATGAYELETKENEITKVTKEQDVKYKTKESAGLDKAVSELSSDKSGVSTELSAVMEYLKSIENQCIAKAETYGERKASRDSEIAGLKDALTILNDETAFLQTSKGVLRGAHRHF